MGVKWDMHIKGSGWGECKPGLEIQSMMTDVTDQWNIFSIFLIWTMNQMTIWNGQNHRIINKIFISSRSFVSDTCRSLFLVFWSTNFALINLVSSCSSSKPTVHNLSGTTWLVTTAKLLAVRRRFFWEDVVNCQFLNARYVISEKGFILRDSLWIS